jgi:Tfp pilus assembly protein PilV
MNQKGQGLIEALIALGAAVIIVSAITIAVITAVSNSDFAKYQNLATGYAQQGMEIVKQKSQLDWNAISTYSGTWCLPQGTTDFYPALGAYTCPLNVDNQFVRQLEFSQNYPSCNNTNTQVEVTVKWTDGKCSGASNFCHHVVLDSCIADIYRTQ